MSRSDKRSGARSGKSRLAVQERSGEAPLRSKCCEQLLTSVPVFRIVRYTSKKQLALHSPNIYEHTYSIFFITIFGICILFVVFNSEKFYFVYLSATKLQVSYIE